MKYDFFFKKKTNESKFSCIGVSKILDKLRNNQPSTYTEKNYISLIEPTGIKLNKPIFLEYFDSLSMNYVKNLWLAKQIQNFNLIVFFNTENDINQYKAFFKDEAKFFNVVDIAKNLKEHLINLNINYERKQSIVLKKTDEIVPLRKFNEEITFENFCIKRKFTERKICLEINQTYYNGHYFFINVKSELEVKYFKLKFIKIIDINKFDYLNFQKKRNHYEIKSLINNFEWHFYSKAKIKNFKLSKIKNSNSYELSCILEIKIEKNSENFYCIYFGNDITENVLNLSDEYIKNSILKKQERMFNLKIRSNDKKLNFYFNKYLPSQIILEGIKNKYQGIINTNTIKNDDFFKLNKEITFYDLIKLHKKKALSSLKIYEIMFKKFLILKEKFIYINKTELANYELKLFFENELKTIYVKSGKRKKMIIGGINYYNCQNISNKILKEYDEFDLQM
ncbi:MAG: hypothetical protein PHI76_02370 [Clostridia bacterium]|nr:hypothetical protein [Clostridia bacterium]